MIDELLTIHKWKYEQRILRQCITMSINILHVFQITQICTLQSNSNNDEKIK